MCFDFVLFEVSDRNLVDKLWDLHNDENRSQNGGQNPDGAVDERVREVAPAEKTAKMTFLD